MSEINIFGVGEKIRILSDGTIDGDISISGDNIKSTDRENLVNRIILRLSIKRGELEADPEVGSELYTMKGLPITEVSKHWMKIIAYDALIRYPMIKDVEKLEVIEGTRGSGIVYIIGN